MIQSFVQSEQLLVVHGGGKVESIQIDAFLSAAVPQVVFASGMINEDAAHGFGGGGKEVRAILPRGLVVPAESQPGFVNQGGGLQGLAGRFTRHFLRGELAQFLIDQRQELVGGVGIALIHAPEDDGEFAHGTN